MANGPQRVARAANGASLNFAGLNLTGLNLAGVHGGFCDCLAVNLIPLCVVYPENWTLRLETPIKRVTPPFEFNVKGAHLAKLRLRIPKTPNLICDAFRSEVHRTFRSSVPINVVNHDDCTTQRIFLHDVIKNAVQEVPLL